MKVKELIAELSKLDPELPVMVDGYEWGLDAVEVVKTDMRYESIPEEDQVGYAGVFRDISPLYPRECYSNELYYQERKLERDRALPCVYLPRKSS